MVMPSALCQLIGVRRYLGGAVGSYPSLAMVSLYKVSEILDADVRDNLGKAVAE